MMQQVEKRTITRDEAVKLTEKMIRKGTINYIIRDELIERGLSGNMANKVIREVRQADLRSSEFEQQNLSHTQVALLIISLFIVLIIFFSIVNPVS